MPKPLAIATTTCMANITALFDATIGREALGWLEVIGGAEQASVKKPDPSVYLWVLELLGLPAAVCLAIEDTHNGVRAALAVLSDLGEPDRPYQLLAGVDVTPGWVEPERLQTWFVTQQKTRLYNGF